MLRCFFVEDQGHPRPKVGGVLHDALRDSDIRSRELEAICSPNRCKRGAATAA